MNAAKIIQEIARLPEDEQGKVVEFVEALRKPKEVRYVDSQIVEKTAQKVFDKHASLFEKLAQ
tara:strand:- start:553 stop:741 length:189 start_codon:yes stop_codon:yes gene_type:complete